DDFHVGEHVFPAGAWLRTDTDVAGLTAGTVPAAAAARPRRWRAGAATLATMGAPAGTPQYSGSVSSSQVKSIPTLSGVTAAATRSSFSTAQRTWAYSSCRARAWTLTSEKSPRWIDGSPARSTTTPPRPAPPMLSSLVPAAGAGPRSTNGR